MRNVTSSQEEAFRLGACGQRNGQTEATTLQMAGGTAGAYDDVVTTDRYSHSELAPEPAVGVNELRGIAGEKLPPGWRASPGGELRHIHRGKL